MAMLLGVAILVMSHTSELFACSVCQGDPNSGLVKGAKAGVLFMAITTYTLLLGMVGVGATWFVRHRRRHMNVGNEASNEEAGDRA